MGAISLALSLYRSISLSIYRSLSLARSLTFSLSRSLALSLTTSPNVAAMGAIGNKAVPFPSPCPMISYLSVGIKFQERCEKKAM